MFRALLNDKIGTIVRHFACHVQHLSLTKLLKLLYITDETSMRETGAPVTWLEYRVWKFGPVADDIYREIKHGQKLSIANQIISLDAYIKIIRRDSQARKGVEEVYINPIGLDNLTSLSDYEIELLGRVVNGFGSMTAIELVDYLHKEGSLWHKAVKGKRLDTNFALYNNTSNHIIDFSDLIEGNEILQMAAHSAYESLSFHKILHEKQLEAHA